MPEELTIRFNPRLLLVSPLAALLMVWLFFLPWDSPAAPAWVQAFGSVVGIGMAAWVAWYSQRKAREARIQDGQERDLAHAVRLHTVIWEAKTAVAGLVVQDEIAAEARKHTEELSALLGPAHSLKVAKGQWVRASDAAFFSRVLQRAMSNLDDDLSPARQAIAARFRYNLSVLVNDLDSRVEVEPDGRLSAKLKKAHDCFSADLDKLSAACPRLKEFASS